MFNFFKKKQKQFKFSNLDRTLTSQGLGSKLRRQGYRSFIDRSKSLKIPKEGIVKNLEKIILDLQNSDIEFIGEAFPYATNLAQTELFLKFRIGKYFLYLTCRNDFDNYFEFYDNFLEDLTYFCEQLEKSLNSKNSFTIFNSDLKGFRSVEFDYGRSFLVFGSLYLNLDFLNDYGFLARQVSEYIKSSGRIILNKFLFEISEMERRDLEKYLKEIKIIGAENIKIANEFNGFYQKVKRLSEINNEIKKLNLEIQNIRKSIL